jgi:hypothetical protein
VFRSSEIAEQVIVIVCLVQETSCTKGQYSGRDRYGQLNPVACNCAWEAQLPKLNQFFDRWCVVGLILHTVAFCGVLTTLVLIAPG